MSELQFREFLVREVDEERRSVRGIAVPYGEEANIGGMRERFERGAFADHEGSVPFFYGHDHRNGGLPIGKVEARDSEDGLEVEAVFSDTPKANEVYTLAKDGVLNKFSVGFQPVKNRKDNGVVVRTAARLHEVSIVPMPAYANAAVSEIRDADNHNEKENEIMSNDNTAPEVAEIREAVSDLERKVATLGNAQNNAASQSQFRSLGEVVKGLAAGKGEEVAMELRAWDGVSLADNDDATRPAYVAKALQLIEPKRPFHNLFRKEALPATGMAYQYPYVTGVTGTAGVQVNEGDDLKMVQITTGLRAASVETLGVAASLSRQVIERSEVAMLETTLRHMYNEYAVLTEGRVAAAFLGATGVQTATVADIADAFAWEEAVDDAAQLIDDNARGLAGEVVVVSRDVFRKVRRLADSTGRPLFAVNGDGSNTVGTLGRTSGNLGGLPVVVIPSLPANSMYVLSTEALVIREDPFKSLQDENIINLTKDFSVYGYQSIDLANNLAIVKVDTDGVA